MIYNSKNLIAVFLLINGRLIGLVGRGFVQNVLGLRLFLPWLTFTGYVNDVKPVHSFTLLVKALLFRKFCNNC